MTMPTKAQIDALVEAMPAYGSGYVAVQGKSVLASHLRTELYLAAGLNADGSEKAKVVRVLAVLYREDSAPGEPDRIAGRVNGTWDGTTFTPDGAK